MTDVNGDLYATNVGLGTRVGVALSEHAFGAGQRRDRGNLLLAVVIGWRTCHNNPCKAPIYRAACPGSPPPDAGLPMTRAHPPEARVIIYFRPVCAREGQGKGKHKTAVFHTYLLTHHAASLQRVSNRCVIHSEKIASRNSGYVTRRLKA